MIAAQRSTSMCASEISKRVVRDQSRKLDPVGEGKERDGEL